VVAELFPELSEAALDLGLDPGPRPQVARLARSRAGVEASPEEGVRDAGSVEGVEACLELGRRDLLALERAEDLGGLRGSLAELAQVDRALGSRLAPSA